MVILIQELIPIFIMYFLWLIIRKKHNIAKYKIIIICCLILVSLSIGFRASYRIVGYSLAQNYLEKINNQKIETFGEDITLKEENELKKTLSENKEFQKNRLNFSIGGALIPSIFAIIITILIFNKPKIINIVLIIIGFLITSIVGIKSIFPAIISILIMLTIILKINQKKDK